MWEPFERDVVFIEVEYGAVVSCPYTEPSRRNSTFVTPTLSVAVTDWVIIPLTVDPFVGVLAATVGADVSPPPEGAVFATDAEALSDGRDGQLVGEHEQGRDVFDEREGAGAKGSLKVEGQGVDSF